MWKQVHLSRDRKILSWAKQFFTCQCHPNSFMIQEVIVSSIALLRTSNKISENSSSSLLRQKKSLKQVKSLNIKTARWEDNILSDKNKHCLYVRYIVWRRFCFCSELIMIKPLHHSGPLITWELRMFYFVFLTLMQTYIKDQPTDYPLW